MVNSIPGSFDLWKSEKKVKDSDLIFTRALKTQFQQDLFHRLSNTLADLKPSFTEGLQLLEMVTDLILMDYTEALFVYTEDLDTYRTYLRNLRYPMTTHHDDVLKHKFTEMPWPQGAKVKFERRGDRAGVEVRFFVSSATDITKLIAALERVQIEMGQ
ncbi:MAG: hypothetical protein A2622_13110 [Bdellovibrionales bacterium RIFCSPHIGHO2_01_FULL_40_29]|nr:MAG: hypothetical protein A2622_13110 [Bdellovibrionales bacterium RIFCSPHIGHO2_01_FULL_40_29]OFZ33371.1 MAG: hypothetical protein A3D17_13775 [Bdellovibrionales bacterium RIFCSPHIGHO2_02_FULL_40_15]